MKKKGRDGDESKRDDEFGIIDTGVNRVPRMSAPWSGSGDYTEVPSDTGTSVGIGTGTSVGIGTGTSVGIGTGTSVGIGTGTSVGIGTGTSVGIGTGTSVGIGTGTSVGIGTGTSVGIGTGTSVGIGTGTSVGIGTGTSVGIGTGTSVGIGANIGSDSGPGSPVFVDTAASAAILRRAMFVSRQRQALTKQYASLVDRIKSGEGFSDHDLISPRDLWRTVRQGQPALSPCGNWVAYVKRERIEGGNLQHEQIFLKRCGAEPGIDEFPVTDGTILADSPVWEPAVFDCESGKYAESDKSMSRLCFRARPTQLDVMQLYIVDLELPVSEGFPIGIGPSMRLTNSPTHPWAPKWRRFKLDKDGHVHSRIYYVAGSGDPSPTGYDHLEFDDAIVGWWNSLALPHRGWRFYELDAESPSTPRDLLGPLQPLLDFINGIWTCWDVHPGGDEIVWAAVDQESPKRLKKKEGNEKSKGWPRDILINIWSMPIQRKGTFEPVRLTTYHPRNDKSRGRRDSFLPSYSPNGGYVVYAERQFSPNPSDFPKLRRIYRKEVSSSKQPAQSNPAVFSHCFDAENTYKRLDIIWDQSNTFLPINWRFQDNETLLVLAQEGGRLLLHTVSVPRNGESPDKNNPNAPDLLDKSKTGNNARRFQDGSNSIHDFDAVVPTVNGKKGALRIVAVDSAMTEPPELNMLVAPRTKGKSWQQLTNDNVYLKSKLRDIGIDSKFISSESNFGTPRSYRCSYPDSDGTDKKSMDDMFQLWVVLPPGHPSAKKGNCKENRSENNGLKYPLVQLLHGGPGSSWLDEFHMRFNASLLASQGYVVGMVNFLGSTNGSEEDAQWAQATGKDAVDVYAKYRKALRLLRKGSDIETFLEDIISVESKALISIEGKNLNLEITPTILKAALTKQGVGWGIFRRLERQASFAQYCKLIQLLKLNSQDFEDDIEFENSNEKKDKYMRKQLDIPEENKLEEIDYEDKLFNKLVNRQELRSSSGWDGYPLADVQKATQTLIDEYYIDENRLALVGASFGGYLGARMLGWKERKHCYKAAVLHAGVYDSMGFFATDAFWAQYDNFGARPWRRADGKFSVSTEFDDGGPESWRQFSRISPLLRSHKLIEDLENSKNNEVSVENRRPAVLLTHGLDDLRVPWQQSLLYHRMLIDHGGKTRLALYPGLGHHLDQPDPSVQWWTEALKWLADNDVKPGPLETN